MKSKSVSPMIIRGIILIVLGILVMFYSEDSIKALGLLPGLIITVFGVAQLAFAFFARKNLNYWQWYLAGGLATIVIGIVLMLNPEFTIKLLIVGVGAWFVFQAVQDFVTGNFWKKQGHPNWWYLLISAVVNATIGVLLVFNPLKGAMTVTVLIGLGMIFGGTMAIVAGNYLRSKYAKTTTDLKP